MIKEWLRARVPGFYSLPEAERKAIADFLLLWPLFEGHILNGKGTVAAILRAVDRWEKAGRLRAGDYDGELLYFRRRYLSGGQPNENFASLHFAKGDQDDLVLAVLGDTDSSEADQLKACLIILYRYRHILFHGPTWHQDLRDQIETFNAANTILMKVLDNHGRLAD